MIDCPRCHGSGKGRATDRYGRPYGPDRCYRCGGHGRIASPWSAAARFARRVADRVDRTRVLLACTTGHPEGCYCPTGDCAGGRDPRRLIAGACERCGTPVVWRQPRTPHF